MFPAVPGLYFLRGENLAQPTLASNGAGKSTFLDAIVWCLFGRTTRELKANDVLSWLGPGSCQVVLDLTIGNQTFKVKRSQKPNHLILINAGIEQPLDQEELQKHLRLNYRSFLYSVMNPQFGESFFSLTPSAKLTLFSEIKELDLWLDKSKSAGAQADGLEKDIRGFETAIAQYQGKIATIEEDIKSLWDDEGKFEATRAAKHVALRASAKKNSQELRKLEHDMHRNQQIHKERVAIYNSYRAKTTNQIRARDTVLDSIQELARKKSSLKDERDKWIAKARQLENLGAVCNVCYQPVSASHKSAQITVIMGKTLAQLDRDILRADEIRNTLMGCLVKEKSNVEVTTEEEQTQARKVSAIWDKIIAGREEHKAGLRRDNDIAKQMSDLHKEENPYSALLDDKKRKLKAFKKIIKESTETKTQLEAELAATLFWVKGFKRVRLFIIEQAFQQLEIEVNNCLVQLGMPDWQVTFDIERENKSGGVTKGFVVFVKGPNNTEPVRWESWSGGETQRLQLAGNMGLSNLIMQQAGLTNTIEIYDEPSTHLSSEGMTDLANMLHERALSEGKCVWIVDHTTMTNFGDFEAIITVRKDKNGSSIAIDA